MEAKLLCACALGNISSVKLLTEVIKCDPNTVRGIIHGETPLHVACENGNIDLVKYLISTHNCDPQCANFAWALPYPGYTPLHTACQNGHLDIARYLITECNCVPEHLSSDFVTPLHVACQSGHLDVARYLISHFNCNPQFPRNDGTTPLHSACFNGHLDIAKFLISQSNCNPECPTFNRETPLHSACFKGYLDIAEYLISQCNCNPRHPNKDGLTALHGACQNGHIDVAKYLISQCNCNPQCHGNDGETPLHQTCLNGHLDTARYLISQCDCNPQCPMNDGSTPLHLVCFNGHVDMARYLIQYGGDPQCLRNDGSTPLSLACLNGHLDVAKYLITECSCNPQHRNNDGQSPLHAASQNGHLDVVRYLISQCSCNPEYPTYDGSTPLHEACFSGHLNVARCLISEYNCNPKRPRSDGITPLHLACLNGHLDIARYLVTRCSCNPRCHSSDGRTLLHVACQNGHFDVVRYLISQCGCNPQNPTNDGTTPLHVACAHGQLDMARYLITQCNINPQCTRNDGISPLHLACLSGHLDMVRYLITQCSCNPQCYGDGGTTPLHAACQNGHLNVARYLITQCSGNPQCRRNDDYTPLHAACQYGHLEVAIYLIANCNSNPECPDSHGLTPLHAACYNGHLNIVQYLITECSCNPNCTDNLGLTPLHWSCRAGHERIVQFLLSTGLCNPLQSNKFGATAIHIAKAKAPHIAEIIRSYYNCVIRYPIESYTKIFTVGDVHVGKSTLVKSLRQNPGLFRSFFGQVFEQHVTGVSAATAGIESFSINSEGFGNVVIHDFAGDYEYYTSQAAFLQSFTSQTTGLFLIVVNCNQTKEKVIESLNYWMSFIQECWGHNVDDSESKAHVIVVGSHADKVRDVSCKYSAIEEVLTSPHSGLEYDGAVCLDCRKPSSPQLGHLHELLDTACSILRKKSIRMDRHCYILYEHLQTCYVKRGFPASTLKAISDNLILEDHPLLPHTPNELLPLLKALHDKGQIVLLENEMEDKCWVVGQKALLLRKCIGKIFAPPGSREYVKYSNTGIVSHSAVEKVFPLLKSDLVIDFMKHFEFCHTIDNPNTLIEHCRTEGRCYLFPALIRLERPSTIWEDSKIDHLSHCCGWYIKCVKAPGKPQFFNSRFLHVLLLRLAFQFALPPDASERSTGLALRQRCKMWKNGVFWSSRTGATIHFELTQHSQTAILLMGCLKGCEMNYVKLRSEIIQTILRVKDETCPLTGVKEGMFADPLKLMKYVNQPRFFLEKMDTFSLTEISAAISQSQPAVVGSRFSSSIRLSALLYFEPYAALSKDVDFISKVLFVENEEREAMSDEPVKVSEQFLARVAQCACACQEQFEDVFELNEATKVAGPNSDFEKCLHILRSWKDTWGFNATYNNFRHTLDSYSIFCGRNPLVSIVTMLHDLLAVHVFNNFIHYLC